MKHIIRDQIKAQLKTLVEKENSAKMLLKYLQPLLENASTIAVYHATVNELNLKDVISYCISQNKQLYQPVSYKSTRNMQLMKFEVSNTDIFSPEEFVPKNGSEWYNLDLILLPLVAVDKNGYRLGKGGGYYDATLANIMQNSKRPILCGVGFDCQLIEHIPKNEWDIRLDYFVSDKQLLKF